MVFLTLYLKVFRRQVCCDPECFLEQLQVFVLGPEEGLDALADLDGCLGQCLNAIL